jgi:murein L,D-transpeptidase YcbB/YkuD
MMRFATSLLLLLIPAAALAQSIESPFAGRRLLEQQLVRYRRLADDATIAPAVVVPTIHPGDALAAAPRLAHWLVALGDLAADVPEPTSYAGELVEGVQRFQVRHGLTPDGVIGASTAKALAVPVGARVRQIELALERLRRMPALPPGRAVFVNVAAFELEAFDDVDAGEMPTVRMSVVAGRAVRTETPFFTALMTTVVYAPYWHVPRSITRKEILPKLRQDPEYLADQDMEIVADGSVLASTPDALAQLAAGRAELRQRPGPLNALGHVKFLLPNPYHVYMHDTPARELFRRTRRDFSHGCIRLADAPALGRWVLGAEGWDAARVDAMLTVEQQTSVPLRHAIPVVIDYATAVARSDGTISFYEDVYGRDTALERALIDGAGYLR